MKQLSLAHRHARKSERRRSNLIRDNYSDTKLICKSLQTAKELCQGLLPFGQLPIMLHNGEVTLQTSSGKVSTLMLESHNFDEKPQDLTAEQVRRQDALFMVR